ncbi:MAG: Biotin and thiamin synthesis associated, partial [Petrotoga mobilis]
MLWIRDKENQKPFIKEDEIFNLLEETKSPSKLKIRDIIQKSLSKERLNPDEVATLLNVEDDETLEEIFEGARTLKRNV